MSRDVPNAAVPASGRAAASSFAAPAPAKGWRRGTHRLIPPGETWRRVEPLLAAAGITRVADVTRLDHLGIPVFQAIRPASRNLSVSQGKGVSAAAARVSATMEALELWHAEDLDPERRPSERLERRVGTVAELAVDQPFDPDRLPWLADANQRRLFADRRLEWLRATPVEAAGEGSSDPDTVPDTPPMAPGARPVVRTASSTAPPPRAAWLPREMVELDFRLAAGFSPRLFHPTSNGLASGNHRDEALVHALCEVVERHALARAHSSPGGMAVLDLATSGPDPGLDPDRAPEASRLVEIARRAGARLRAFDLTPDVALATVLVELALPDHPMAWRGSGCHPSPEVAFCRALTEAAQSRLTYISGARDDVAYDDARRADPHRAHAAFTEPPPTRRLDALPDRATDSLAGDLAAVVDALAATGRRAWFVELTRPDLGDDSPVHVVRAFVPGLGQRFHG